MRINTTTINSRALFALLAVKVAAGARQDMTVAQFKTLLRRQGKTIREWADERGFPPRAVYRVLNGLDKAHFGRAHDIAVAAGIKAGDQQQLAA
ncbi:MAG TPA: DNA-binding protein [Rhodocyclaceae bacterium]|nr:DNA-binding protein [Rhodocyclaceae bacterium]